MNSNLFRRFWEVDFLRGAAIILMVVSNAVTDLNYFGVFGSPAGGFWWWFARFVAFAFVFLAGVSLALSHSRALKLKKRGLFGKYLRRGVRIFGWGLLISAVTRLFLGQDFVAFGALHLIGAAIILAYPLLGHRRLSLLLGAVFVAVGVWLQGFVVDFPWLLWLGLAPKGYTSVDYFPLLPWFGVALLGLAAGSWLYPNYKRSFGIRELSGAPVRLLCFLGRHSLFIYLLHQPIIVAGLWALGVVELSWF
jgi:uncharacterized membrane protein